MIGTLVDLIDRFFDRWFASRPSWVLLSQMFVGLGWMRASVAKLVDPQWWDGTGLTQFIQDHQSAGIGWYQPVLDGAIADHAMIWAAVIVASELAVALSLFTSVRPWFGLVTATFLNINFLLVGAPNPSIFYLILQIGLLMWLLETSPSRVASTRWLRGIQVGGVVLALACVSSVQTLQPAGVVDDPAMVLVTGATCAVVAAVAARRRVRRRHLFGAALADGGPQPADRVLDSSATIDVRRRDAVERAPGG